MGKRTEPKSSPTRTVRKRLMYNICGDALVFAEPDVARFISRIHEAISNSSTWEEFRRAMPRSEYSRMIREWFDDQGEPRPRGCDKFDAEQIPGYCDGDYPDWLQQTMDRVLPEEIMEEFAEGENSVLNGPYFHIDAEHLPEITARLKQLGYAVEDGTHLSFH
jgi:hypothetical protein